MGQVATRAEKLAFAYRHCEAELRQHDPDRYFSTLFAPAQKRPHLFALYAFSSEVARIHDVSREPLMGEIRMQWWRDALAASSDTDQNALPEHPVVAALADTIHRHDLPMQVFTALIDARVFDLYDDPMPTLADLEGYCGETCSVLFQLAAMILAGSQHVASSDVSGHGGVAYAITGLLRAFPWHARRRNVYLPSDLLAAYGVNAEDVTSGNDTANIRNALFGLRDIASAHLDKAMALVPSVPMKARIAFLPLMLTGDYLRQIGGRTYQPFQTVVELTQLRKQWILWRAARRFR